jgi:hypothetical protein
MPTPIVEDWSFHTLGEHLLLKHLFENGPIRSGEDYKSLRDNWVVKANEIGEFALRQQPDLFRNYPVSATDPIGNDSYHLGLIGFQEQPSNDADPFFSQVLRIGKTEWRTVHLTPAGKSLAKLLFGGHPSYHKALALILYIADSRAFFATRRGLENPSFFAGLLGLDLFEALNYFRWLATKTWTDKEYEADFYKRKLPQLTPLGASEATSLFTADRPETVGKAVQNDDESTRKIVFALHGIRTHADWQRAFGHVAANHGWRCSTDRWNYGYFSLLHFFLHFQRLAKVKWFRSTYHTEMHDVDFKWTTNSLPSVVAHSFGTYILGNALLKYDWLKFDRIILCGSILPPDFPWLDLIAQGRVQAVRNEYGIRDVWTKTVTWFIRGTGPSGRSGFNAAPSERFEQEEFEYDHSEYFDKGHMEAKWMPFLKRKLPVVAHAAQRLAYQSRTTPWGLYVIYLAVLCCALWLLFWLWR